MAKNIYDQLQDAIKDEEKASLMYAKLSEEIEKRGLHRSAQLLIGISKEEARHKETLQEIVEEVKVVGALVGAAEPTGKVYWYVGLGWVIDYEKFDDVEAAKEYVEAKTGKDFSEAKWINAYGFELGPYNGENYISFFEGDEKGQPTICHLWDKFS